MSRYVILVGNCLDTLKSLPDNSVDAVITDPPYGLEFMGKGWDKGVPGVEFWVEFLRVAKPGAMLLSFGGTRTYHRMTCAIEDAGWLLRDCMQWLYATGFPKGSDLGKTIGDEWDGYGTSLKPAWEPIVMAMKPLDGTFAQNAEKWGVAGLWIDGVRISTTDTGHRPNKGGLLNSGASYGAGVRKSDWTMDEKGRWPTNVILDEYAAAELDRQSGISKPKPGRKGKRGGNGFGMYDDAKSAAHEGVWPADPGGGASRFFFVTKASKSEKNYGLPEGVANPHPTVKPVKLMQYLCRMVRMPTNGTILDPFAGSGSTGVAAIREGFNFVGCELTQEYVPILEARVDTAEKEFPCDI